MAIRCGFLSREVIILAVIGKRDPYELNRRDSENAPHRRENPYKNSYRSEFQEKLLQGYTIHFVRKLAVKQQFFTSNGE